MTDRTATFQAAQTPLIQADPGVLQSGSVLGPYELRQRLASGGMADVWIAVRRGEFGFRQVFAIKTIRPEYARNAAFRTMFLDEARVASRVRHTNVLAVLDLGQEGETVYQAMPLVEGASAAELRSRLSRASKAFPVEVAVRICIDVARGLHVAHEVKDESGRAIGLVHRDVSPQNVLIGTDGIAKVSDFGIAKAKGLSSHTDVGQVKGKRGYLAPEQIREEPVDRRADIFALGVVLWELLAGRPLFKTGDSAMFFNYVPSAEDVRLYRPAVSPEIAAAIALALEASVDSRFQTAEAFGDALEDAARVTALALSAKEVGRLVEDLVGPEIAERGRVLTAISATGSDRESGGSGSELAPEASTKDLLPWASTVLATPVLPSADLPLQAAEEQTARKPRKSPTKRAIWPLPSAFALLILAVLTMALWQNRQVPSSPPVSSMVAETTAVVPMPSSSAMPSSSSPVVESSPSSVSVAVAAIATASSASATPHVTPHPRPSPSPLPKFSKNPYGH